MDHERNLEPFDYAASYLLEEGVDPRAALERAVNDFAAFMAVAPPVKIWRTPFHVIGDRYFDMRKVLLRVRARGFFDADNTYQGRYLYRNEVMM